MCEPGDCRPGDTFYVKAKDPGILGRAESGGAVSSLLKFALETGMVDAVLAVEKGADTYDAKPVLVTDPSEIARTTGSLHCGTLSLPGIVKKYLGGAADLKLGTALKGCDVMGLYELAKRGEIDLDNVLMLGLNCGGQITPHTAREMIREKFGVDPDSIRKERVSKGKFIILAGEPEVEIGLSIDELEEENYGRRKNCRRCKMKVPRQADLACGEWGVLGTKATFVETCSEKGALLLDKARAAGVIETSLPPGKGLEIREKIEKSMHRLAESWREKDFEALGSGKSRMKQLIDETSRCIKCYTCVDACPVLSGQESKLAYRSFAGDGAVPPAAAFHLLRYALVADSCINCGQCEELCPMDIPNSLFMHSFAVELQELYGYQAGQDLSPPKIAPLETRPRRK